MKLKKFDSVTAPALRSQTTPLLTLRLKGPSTINGLLTEMMKLKPEQRVALFQDESDPDNWYIAKDGKEGFSVRAQYDKKMTGVMFNAGGAVKCMFDYFQYKEAAARCVVGKEPVKEDGQLLFPILYSLAQNQEKPKRKYTRKNAEERDE